MTRWVAMLAVMLCHVVAGQAHVLAEPARIQVKIVKYDGLKEIVRQNRGNVVVVYFWTTCNLPAVKWHADILAIHRKHKAKGLVTVSVAMDQAGETGGDETPKQRDERVLERLTRLNSAVVNVVLDESHQFLSERFGVLGPPFVYVFNRQGKWHRVSYREEELLGWSRIEELIVNLLKEKP